MGFKYQYAILITNLLLHYFNEGVQIWHNVNLYGVDDLNSLFISLICLVFFDFSHTIKAAPHECVIRTGQL